MDPVLVALVWRHCFVSSKCKARRGNLTKPESFLAFPNDRKDYSWVSSACAPSSLGWPKNVFHCFSSFDPVRLLWYWAEWKLKVGTIKMVKGWGLHVCVWGENGKHCFMPNTACCNLPPAPVKTYHFRTLRNEQEYFSPHISALNGLFLDVLNYRNFNEYPQKVVLLTIFQIHWDIFPSIVKTYFPVLSSFEFF